MGWPLHFKHFLSVAHEDGLRWLAYRLWYEVQLRYGFRRSLPPVVDLHQMLARACGVPSERLEQWLVERWVVEGGEFPHIEDSDILHSAADLIVKDAQRILGGELRFFGARWVDTGHPPDWLRGKDGVRWPRDLHWSTIPDLSPIMGDIKEVWEPSRFGQTFALVRAYALTGDDVFAEAFWTQVDDWIQCNSPELGPHWRCAQEMSLRCMAWTFGLYSFRRSPASSPDRIARLIAQIWYHACHIEKVHWYAANCVRNNHAISEAVGLYTVGTLFPYLPHAERWRNAGLRWLERELSWQVYDDGAYVQNSVNYSRFVVQLLTWTIAIARANRVQLPALVADRARRLLRFLVALQDPSTGRLPNYGPNDGALILPLSSCDYLDYRPALQALSLALDDGRLYEPGPWDEEALWLLGPTALEQSYSPLRDLWNQAVAFPNGGYYTLRGPSTHAFIRCTTHRHRPAQADMLHLDVWYEGQNVMLDPGTLSYNLPAPWARYFAGTEAHNTVSVDGKDQMDKGPRFMWLRWTKGKCLEFTTRPGLTKFVGEHYGYSPVVHRRKVILVEDLYVVIDYLDDHTGAAHTYRLHWLVADLPMERDRTGATVTLPTPTSHQVRVEVLSTGAQQIDWTYGDETPPRGWHSLYYGLRSPAWSLASTVRGTSVRFVTCIGPVGKVRAVLERCSWNADLVIQYVGSGGLLTELTSAADQQEA